MSTPTTSLQQIRNTLINQLYHLRSIRGMPVSDIVDNETLVCELRELQATLDAQRRRIEWSIQTIEDLIYQRCTHTFVQDNIDFVESSQLIQYCEHCGLERRDA